MTDRTMQIYTKCLKIRIYKSKESTKEKQMEDTVILCLLLSRIGKTDAVQACSTAIGGALYARMGDILRPAALLLY